MTRVVLVPGVLALLPEHAGLEDPVAELRAACLAAVGWLGARRQVLAGEQGGRVARAPAAPRPTAVADEPSYLVVGNGSAKRTEKAPGHFDERAEAFDAALGGVPAGRDAGRSTSTLARRAAGPTSTRSCELRRARLGSARHRWTRRRAVRRAVLGDAVELAERWPSRATPTSTRSTPLPALPWLRVNMVSTVDGAATGPDGKSGGDQQRRRQAGLRHPAPALRRGGGRRRHRPRRGLPGPHEAAGAGQPARRGAAAAPRRRARLGADGDLRRGRAPRRDRGMLGADHVLVARGATGSTWPFSSHPGRAGPDQPAERGRPAPARATCSPRAWSTSSTRRSSRGCSAGGHPGSSAARRSTYHCGSGCCSRTRARCSVAGSSSSSVPRARRSCASRRDGPYHVSSRPLTSLVSVPGKASGPSSAVKT